MISKKKEKRDWTMPFTLLHSALEFNQLPTNKETAHHPLGSVPRNKQQIIITPKIQVLSQNAGVRAGERKNCSHYIKVHARTNLPQLHSYELTQVELHFMNASLLQHGIAEDCFADALVALQKSSVQKGLEIGYEAILGPVLEHHGLKKPKRLRRRHGEGLEAVMKTMYHFWRKKRVINGFGNFPFFRPLWPKNDLSGGPFKQRGDNRIVLRNRVLKLEEQQLQQIIRDDLFRLKQMVTLILEREENEIELINNIIEQISKNHQPSHSLACSQTPAILNQKKKDPIPRQGKEEVNRNNKKSRGGTVQKTAKKGKQEQVKESMKDQEWLEAGGEKGKERLFTGRGRYTRSAVKAFAEDEAVQGRIPPSYLDYNSIKTRQYYTRGNYRVEMKSISSSFEGELELSIGSLINRFRNQQKVLQ